MKNRFALSLAISASFLPCQAYAGAWLQEEGKGQVITTFRYYSTDQFFDDPGHKTKIAPFTKAEISPYFEYGVRDYLTLGGEISGASVNNDSGSLESPQFSYANVFARAYVFKGDDYVISAEPGITFPASLGEDLVTDGEKPIPEFKLSLGRGLGFFGSNQFFDASVKYRYRSDDGLKDMIKAELTFGFEINEDFTGLLQVSHEQVLGDIEPGSVGNYNLTKPQLSIVYDPKERFSHQLGVFSNVYGENTGAGYGAFYSLWYKF